LERVFPKRAIVAENQLRSRAPWSLILNFFEIEILKFQKNPKKFPDVGNNVLYGLAKS
jgi:hypothetical protein